MEFLYFLCQPLRVSMFFVWILGYHQGWNGGATMLRIPYEREFHLWEQNHQQVNCIRSPSLPWLVKRASYVSCPYVYRFNPFHISYIYKHILHYKKKYIYTYTCNTVHFLYTLLHNIRALWRITISFLMVKSARHLGCTCFQLMHSNLRTMNPWHIPIPSTYGTFVYMDG